MTLSLDQLQVTSFEVSPSEPVALSPFTPPVAGCYSPLCIPTELKEQCPETNTVAGAGA